MRKRIFLFLILATMMCLLGCASTTGDYTGKTQFSVPAFSTSAAEKSEKTSSTETGHSSSVAETIPVVSDTDTPETEAAVQTEAADREQTNGPTDATASVTEAAESTSRNYVLNTNTRKFHYPGCSSAARIKDKNRQEYHGTREELIQRGYVPCKNCNP